MSVILPKDRQILTHVCTILPVKRAVGGSPRKVFRRNDDILICATGFYFFFKMDWLKKGHLIIIVIYCWTHASQLWGERRQNKQEYCSVDISFISFLSPDVIFNCVIEEDCVLRNHSNVVSQRQLREFSDILITNLDRSVTDIIQPEIIRYKKDKKDKSLSIIEGNGWLIA